MASSCIPRIDIAPMLAGDPVGKRRIAEQVRDALETIGFLFEKVLSSRLAEEAAS